MTRRLTLLLLLIAAPVYAQPRPGAFTTLTTTGNFTDGGTLTVNGFGLQAITASGTGSETLRIQNMSAGATNVTSIQIGNNIDSGLGQLNSYASSYVPVNVWDQANVTTLMNRGNGINLVASAGTGVIDFYTGGNSEWMQLNADGSLAISGSVSSMISTGSGTINAGTGYFAGRVSGTSFSSLNSTTLSMKNSGSVTLAQFDATGGPLMATWSTTASAANAVVANGDYVRLSTSLRANKHDIAPIALSDARHTVMGLQAVLYESAIDADQRQWAGFIADDVEKVNPILAVYTPQGKLQSVTYDRVPAYLLPVVQDHEARLKALEALLAR